MIECYFASLLGERVPLEKKFQKSSAIRFYSRERRNIKANKWNRKSKGHRWCCRDRNL